MGILICMDSKPGAITVSTGELHGLISLRLTHETLLQIRQLLDLDKARAPVLTNPLVVLSIELTSTMLKECGKNLLNPSTLSQRTKEFGTTYSGEEERSISYLIPSIRFSKVVLFHLQRLHNFHPRPESPLHLPTEEPALGYFSFQKGSVLIGGVQKR
ncbi:hypothetical protein Tco_1295273 [Tanacetum coccineum]